MKVEMYRKPENGEGIHNAAYGQSGFMMRLRIVKSARNEAEHEYDEENLPHGTKFLKELVLSWDNMDKIIWAESYFASVPAAE